MNAGFWGKVFRWFVGFIVIWWFSSKMLNAVVTNPTMRSLAFYAVPGIVEGILIAMCIRFVFIRRFPEKGDLWKNGIVAFGGLLGLVGGFMLVIPFAIIGLAVVEYYGRKRKQ